MGASGDADVGLYGGAAYLFGRRESEWQLQTKLTAASEYGGTVYVYQVQR